MDERVIMSIFKSYRNSVVIRDEVKNRHIIVGEYSYYAGYYHGVGFEECVMYLDRGDEGRGEGETDRLIIGKFCSIASGAKFMMGGTQGHNYNWIAVYPLDEFDEDYDGYMSTGPKAHKLKGDTVVGNDVWVGMEALIMPGVKIGDGAVIGARAVVTKSVGAYEVWGGNPARLIKKRFRDEEIEKLLEIRWWDWEVGVLKRNLSYLRSGDVEGLWKRHKEGGL